jgi:hypothetical protein
MFNIIIHEVNMNQNQNEVALHFPRIPKIKARQHEVCPKYGEIETLVGILYNV